MLKHCKHCSYNIQTLFWQTGTRGPPARRRHRRWRAPACDVAWITTSPASCLAPPPWRAACATWAPSARPRSLSTGTMATPGVNQSKVLAASIALVNQRSGVRRGASLLRTYCKCQTNSAGSCAPPQVRQKHVGIHGHVNIGHAALLSGGCTTRLERVI